MGSFDEILKSNAKILAWLSKIYTVTNSGFDVKILEELSGFQNIWSGLNEIEAVNRSGFENLSGLLEQKIVIEQSGFAGIWDRLDTLSGLLEQKINVEVSGFQNVQSGLNDVEAEVIQLQTITNSGLDTIHTDLQTKITIEQSGLNDIETEIIQLQTINNSGLDTIHQDLLTKILVEQSGFQNTWSGLQEIRDAVSALSGITVNVSGITVSGLIVNISGIVDVASGIRMLRQGETTVLSNGESIAGGVSGQLGCYDRWTLYLATSGAIDVTLELTPDTSAPYFWFEPSESPVSVASGGFDVIEMGYDCTWIRLTGSNPSGVTVRIRGCW